MIEVAAAVAIRGGEVLLASRPPDKPPAGWEFPGGKLEPGEDLFGATRKTAAPICRNCGKNWHGT